MNLYIVLYLALGLNVLFSHGFQRKGRLRIYCISCLYLLLAAVLRHPSDPAWPDTANYLNTFSYISKQLPWSDLLKSSGGGWEPGIVVLIKCIGTFWDNNQAYIIILGMIIMMPIFVMIWKYSEFPCLSLFVFFAMGNLTSTSIYRQWCAMAILTFSLKYVYERKLFPFISLLLLACIFHRASVIFGIVYFIYEIKVSIKSIMGAAVISGSIYILGSRLLVFLNHFARLPLYELSNGGMSFFMVLWLSILGAYILCKSRFNDPRFRLPFHMVLVAAAVQPLAFTLSLWYRVTLFFSLYMVLLLPYVIVHIVRVSKNNRKLLLLVEGSFMAVMFLWFRKNGIPAYLPMWSNV